MITMNYFLYGNGALTARRLAQCPLQDIRFDYSVNGGRHGGPTCDSKFLYRHFSNCLVQVVNVNFNIISINIY